MGTYVFEGVELDNKVKMVLRAVLLSGASKSAVFAPGTTGVFGGKQLLQHVLDI